MAGDECTGSALITGMNPIQFIEKMGAGVEHASLIFFGLGTLTVPDVIGAALGAAQKAGIAGSPVMIQRSEGAVTVAGLFDTHVAGQIPFAIPLAPEQRAAPLMAEQPLGGALDGAFELAERDGIALFWESFAVRVVLRGQYKIERRSLLSSAFERAGGDNRARERTRHAVVEQAVNVRLLAGEEATIRRHLKSPDRHLPPVRPEAETSAGAEIFDEIGCDRESDRGHGDQEAIGGGPIGLAAVGGERQAKSISLKPCFRTAQVGESPRITNLGRERGDHQAQFTIEAPAGFGDGRILAEVLAEV